MGLPEDLEKELYKHHQDLCKSLNLDKVSGTEAWKSFSKVYDCYILEGEPIHWLGCAIYVACRNASAPAIGKTSVLVQGNLVNLARLLKLINLSLVEFLTKIQKWGEIVQLPQDFVEKLRQLERNFTVSVVIFKKFQPIFSDMFCDPSLESSKSSKSKKHKIQPVSIWRTFEFTWTLFVCVKSRYPKISDDLVSSYHLLLACCDYIFVNAVISGRKDLINDNFPRNHRNFRYSDSSEMPCIIDHLCERHNGVAVESKEIKEYRLKNHIKLLFERKILKGNPESLTDILDSNNFEYNIKSINRVYEEYVLSAGDFDERIFFGDYKKFILHGGGGSSEKSLIGFSVAAMDICSSEFQDKLASVPEQTDTRRNTPLLSKTFPPLTPLTGKIYLGKKDNLVGNDIEFRGIPTLKALQNFLLGTETRPTEFTLNIIRSCPDLCQMEAYVDKMVQDFSERFTENSEFEKVQKEVIIKLENSIKKLYYKLLDPILNNEVQKSAFDANHLLGQEIFHKTLFCCAAEIVLFSHNGIRPFEWVLSKVGITPYHFYRIIEIVVRTQPSLCRELIKHLNRIEETILESLAWQRDSPLWKGILDSGKPIPTSEDVTTHCTTHEDQNGSDNVGRHNPRNSVDQLALLAGKESILTYSPGGPLSERFSSPLIAGKRLMIDNSTDGPPSKFPCGVARVQVQKEGDKNTKENRRPKRTGALALFFRKFYYLASVRMQDMCHQLSLSDIDLRRKIWTCFELSIVNHIGLMLDRHLDQILMCAVYVICRIVGPEKTFTDVMKCYRNQPQAQSSVYRNVLVSPDISLEEFKKIEDCESLESEERGDLIKFYNSVYVKNVKSLLLRFKEENNEKERVVLSPIPVSKSPPGPRKVTENFALFLRTQGQEKCEVTSKNHISYCFNQSPAKDLHAINKMVKLDGFRVSKKLLQNDDDHKTKPGSGLVNRKVQGLRVDRIALSQE